MVWVGVAAGCVGLAVVALVVGAVVRRRRRARGSGGVLPTCTVLSNAKTVSVMPKGGVAYVAHTDVVVKPVVDLVTRPGVDLVLGTPL